jgi:hypothetical protein
VDYRTPREATMRGWLGRQKGKPNERWAATIMADTRFEGIVMSSASAGVLLRHLRSVSVSRLADRNDGELLRAFAASRDEAAFATLVRRHGPLVWGICRRVLRHEQDAEDAFQATFLVLAKRATSIR